MAVVVATLGVFVGPITQVVKVVTVPLFMRPLGYLVHYKRNVKELRRKMVRLEHQKTSVQRLVDVERERGQDITEEVTSWISKVNATEEAVKTVMKVNATEEEAVTAVMALDVAIQENNGCLWDCLARYRFGKGAKIKTDEVNNLLRERDQFGDAVSIPPTAPRVIETMPLLPNFQVFEPTKSAMNQIREALEDKKFKLVGVYGMGGVGKTTLMEAMAKQLKNRRVFDRVVMVTVSQNPILKNIQNAIAENLGYKFREDDESVRASRLWERIKQETRILIILDDVWKELSLREVGIPYGDKDDCSVIINTRFLDVCGDMNAQCNVEVKDLPKADAFRLFRMIAGECVDSSDLHDVAEEVVKECGGLPMAIVTVGKALRNKDRIVWVDAITQLKGVIPSRIPGMEPRVFSSIKYSYDRLQNQETQLCFLFCSLFPEDFIISEDDLLPYVLGENIFEATETLKKARNRLHTVLDTLKRSCLLLNVDKHEKNEGVRMHDVIRDVAIWIAKEDHGFIVEVGKGLKEWPNNMKNLQKCNRVSLMQNEISKLPERKSCFQLMTLSLQDNPLREIPSEFFEGMISLKVLDLKYTDVVSIPSSFSRLTELRVLSLSRRKIIHSLFPGNIDLSFLWKMKKLEMLHLSGWDLKTLPQEIGGLTNLKSLDLSKNSQLVIPPKVLSRLSLLEELDLSWSFDEWEVEGSENSSKAGLSEVASFSGLTKLKLEVSNIEYLSFTFPFCWENLKHFLIMFGRFDFFDQTDLLSQGCYSAKMCFYRLTIPELLNWGKGFLGRTEYLHFTECHGLKNIYPGLGGGNGLNNLRCLEIKECEDLEHILIAEEESVPILAFNRLEELKLTVIPNLRKIYHGCFLKGSLVNLRSLLIFKCHNLRHIFEMSMTQGLPQLEEISIGLCNDLEEIFMKNEGEDETGKVVLPRLRFLELISLPNFSTVCQVVSLHDFPVFERLCIYNCPILKGLPISLSPKSTPNLKEIKVEETWFNQLEWDEPSDKLHLLEWGKVKFMNDCNIYPDANFYTHAELGLLHQFLTPTLTLIPTPTLTPKMDAVGVRGGHVNQEI